MPGPIVEDIQTEKDVQVLCLCISVVVHLVVYHDEHPVIEDVNEEDDHNDVDADSEDDQEDGAQGRYISRIFSSLLPLHTPI
uniref:Uncharacterized protein n=1 Tax=Lactuca sativa TaxID=4236 RepID=A0A9R1WIS0_LACSA|nr:hypothetical protein LSAT_V11C200101050 [Lactuca sativa]